MISHKKYLRIIILAGTLAMLPFLYGCGPVMMANKMTNPEQAMKCGGMMKMKKCDNKKSPKEESDMKCSSGKS